MNGPTVPSVSMCTIFKHTSMPSAGEALRQNVRGPGKRGCLTKKHNDNNFNTSSIPNPRRCVRDRCFPKMIFRYMYDKAIRKYEAGLGEGELAETRRSSPPRYKI